MNRPQKYMPNCWTISDRYRSIYPRLQGRQGQVIVRLWWLASLGFLEVSGQIWVTPSPILQKCAVCTALPINQGALTHWKVFQLRWKWKHIKWHSTDNEDWSSVVENYSCSGASQRRLMFQESQIVYLFELYVYGPFSVLWLQSTKIKPCWISRLFFGAFVWRTASALITCKN